MLKIRLTRRGKKNKAFFRLVVAEHSSPIKGRFVEALGFLNPHTKERKFEEDRIKYWIGKGAQCSDSVHNMLVRAGIVKGPKRAVKMKKKEETSEPAEKATTEKKEEVKVEESSVEKKDEKKEESKEEVKKEKMEEKTEVKAEDKKEEKKPEEAKVETKKMEKKTEEK
jgi:small subunit ribosomal protein S16